MNRLINEKSPYLLQHANNPVDWYPWGEEAFTKAKAEDKPIFLSIGYSTCYWCHVMEREVFEHEAIAEIMNNSLVCIKVDREEQPDIDRIYMSAVQAMTGSGGWPMSVFLTHDLKPFFGGTYFPPAPRHGRPGFPQLVQRIAELWKTDRQQICQSGNSIADYLKSNHARHSISDVNEQSLSAMYENVRQMFDPVNGGFGHAPKFPRPSVFNALLRYYARSKKNEALHIVLHTLRKMAHGGIYDHLGGGFHRYSVDELWHVPHFEKMLYDQAQLVCSYLEAYQITHDEYFANIARDILSYVLRQMTHPDGGFYSAEDAESAFSHDHPHEKEEGTFYLWTEEEIRHLLNESAELFMFHYGVETQGNAPSDPMGVFSGKNILYQRHSLEESAARFGFTMEQTDTMLCKAKKVLFNARNQRPHPLLDDKIITAWNGLMISAFARAGQIFQEKVYTDAATASAQFILSRLWIPEQNKLFRRWRDGEARFPATLQDYAFFIQSLLDLYEATFETQWLNHALTLTHTQCSLFSDTESGGFFDSADGDPAHIVRMKEEYDGAEPTGNSVAALNLLRLSLIASKPEWQALAEQTIRSFGTILAQRSDILPQMLLAVDWITSAPKEMIIHGEQQEQTALAILHEIHQRFIPVKIVLLADSAGGKKYLQQFLPFIKELPEQPHPAMFYLCENFACQLPLSDITAIRQQLNTLEND